MSHIRIQLIIKTSLKYLLGESIYWCHWHMLEEACTLFNLYGAYFALACIKLKWCALLDWLQVRENSNRLPCKRGMMRSILINQRSPSHEINIVGSVVINIKLTDSTRSYLLDPSPFLFLSWLNWCQTSENIL